MPCVAWGCRHERQPPSRRDPRRRCGLNVSYGSRAVKLAGSICSPDCPGSGHRQERISIFSEPTPNLRIARSGSSNSMLGSPPTTPQDYPETSGFPPQQERECGRGRDHQRHRLAYWNSSLEHVQVGGQAIEPPDRGEGAKKKQRINPVHQLSPPENDGLNGARQVSVTAQGNQPGTPGGSRKSRSSGRI
jgi:hypothetical protein